MNIAVTHENVQIFQHFGHCPQFKLYTVSGGQITSTQVVDTQGSGHGALAGFLAQHQVEALICGGIGAGARSALAQAGIRLYPGVTGSADDAVSALLSGTLAFDPDTLCDHHHDEGHACGGHCHEDHAGCSGSC